MTWDVHLMKAPGKAVFTEDAPEGYGRLGQVAHVVGCLRSIVPEEWFANAKKGAIPSAWFTAENIWGGVDCDVYSLRIYFQTAARELEPLAPVTETDIVEQVHLAFQPGIGPHDRNPHRDMGHPAWDFIAAACRALECRAEDDGRFLGPDGRPIPLPEPKRPWWRFWR
jgi:hypothetical protein